MGSGLDDRIEDFDPGVKKENDGTGFSFFCQVM